MAMVRDDLGATPLPPDRSERIIKGHHLTPNGATWTCKGCHEARHAAEDYLHFACEAIERKES